MLNNQSAALLLESLSSEWRLAIFRLLAQCGTTGMVAGELAQALNLTPSKLSFHLKSLTQAGLLSVQQEGRYQRYRADTVQLQELIIFLTDKCCAGHPEQCLPALPDSTKNQP